MNCIHYLFLERLPYFTKLLYFVYFIVLLYCCEYLKNTYNIQIKFVKTDELGEVDFDDLDNVLRENQNSLVSLMHGNNEIGNINDIEKISNICAQYGVIFHSDTVQTMGHYKLNLNEINVHGVVGSAHKFHGPKGIGFLYLNNNHKISPFIHGGSQERNMRRGTENVYGIIGLSEAMSVAVSDMNNHSKKILSSSNG